MDLERRSDRERVRFVSEIVLDIEQGGAQDANFEKSVHHGLS